MTILKSTKGCLVCRHSWISWTPTPLVCPRCNSRRWNKGYYGINKYNINYDAAIGEQLAFFPYIWLANSDDKRINLRLTDRAHRNISNMLRRKRIKFTYTWASHCIKYTRAEHDAAQAIHRV